MNTQRSTVDAIVDEVHGDYCLALKGNQKTAYQEVKDYFSDEELLKGIREQVGQYLKETEETSYRIVTREYYITDGIRWFADRNKWKKRTSFGYERKIIFNKETGKMV